MARAPRSKLDPERKQSDMLAGCSGALSVQAYDDYLAASLMLTAGVGAINATLQMMLAQSVAFGESVRSHQQSASLARTAELAALGTMLGQMFPERSQVREVAIQRTVTQAPPMLAVS